MLPHKRCVYFLRSGDAIKIGCTNKMADRFAVIARDIGNQVECIGWVYGNFATELLIHKHLADYAEGNEWFRDCAEVRSLIEYLVRKGPHFQGLPVRGRKK